MGADVALSAPTHYCPRCLTEYFDGGDCDWCPFERLLRNPRGVFTQEELAELRQQHASMSATFSKLPFETVMADPVLRGCLINTVHANKARLRRMKAKSAEEASNFELSP